MQYVAFSGGKDSTALALLMAEAGEEFELLHTPTGDEPAALTAHLADTTARTGKRLHMVQSGQTLESLIRGYEALPNHRQRWCTRQLKIEPCIAFLLERPGSVLCVGLRADEEERVGIYGDFASYRYPLREAGMDVAHVWDFLDERSIKVPARTDCELCYGQRISEWYLLWRDQPEKYAKGKELERMTGHTFRSPSRDTWPAGLADLEAEFKSGRTPKLPLPTLFDNVDVCRVCRM